MRLLRLFFNTVNFQCPKGATTLKTLQYVCGIYPILQQTILTDDCISDPIVFLSCHKKKRKLRRKLRSYTVILFSDSYYKPLFLLCHAIQRLLLNKSLLLSSTQQDYHSVFISRSFISLKALYFGYI